jgi:hypothetical protein
MAEMCRRTAWAEPLQSLQVTSALRISVSIRKSSK